MRDTQDEHNYNVIRSIRSKEKHVVVMVPKSSCRVKNCEGVVFLNFVWKETFEEIPVAFATGMASV